MKTLKRAGSAAVLVAAVAAASVTGGAAHASKTPQNGETAAASAASSCGYLGSGWYNHCGSTTVMVRSIDVFNNTVDHCVAPGKTDLQDWRHDWAITNAWYIGGANC